MDNETLTPDSIENKRSIGIRPFIPTSFALTIVCFFFTFIEFQCKENKKTDSVTGINLVMGNGMESFDIFGEIPNAFGEAKDIQPPNLWAIITLGAAVIGLVVFLLRLKNENFMGIILGIIGSFSLIFLQLILKIKMEEELKDNYIAVFKFGYWAAMLSLIMASILSFIQLIKDKTKVMWSKIVGKF